MKDTLLTVLEFVGLVIAGGFNLASYILALLAPALPAVTP